MARPGCPRPRRAGRFLTRPRLALATLSWCPPSLSSATAKACGTRQTCLPVGPTSTCRPRARMRRVAAGALLAAEPGLVIDVVYTSVLTRAVRTADLALSVAGTQLPAGAPPLAAERAPLRPPPGDEQEGGLRALRRRAGEVLAPRLPHPARPGPPRRPEPPRERPPLRGRPPRRPPGSECLADVVRRLVPYFEDSIGRDLLEGTHGARRRPRQQPPCAGEVHRAHQRR